MKVEMLTLWRGMRAGQMVELSSGIATVLIDRGFAKKVTEDGKQVERKKDSRSSGGTGNRGSSKRSPKSVNKR